MSGRRLRSPDFGTSVHARGLGPTSIRNHPPAPRLIVHGFTISLDGFGAGPQQSLEAPLGIGGEALHDWIVLPI